MSITLEFKKVSFFVENNEQMFAVIEFIEASDAERARMLTKAVKEEIEVQKCICCHKDSIVDIGSMSFCQRCLSAKNVFVDAKPVDLLDGLSGFLTPNFKAFMMRKDLSITWVQFDKEYQR